MLLASYYFYSCWSLPFLSILVFDTVLSYTVSLTFEKKGKFVSDKTLLVISIFLLLLPLCSFKYLDFMCSSIKDIASLAGFAIEIPRFGLMLPIGISYFTFMSIGYVVDVYQKKMEPEKDIVDYSLFIAFFPHLASGPIGRANQLLPQIKRHNSFLFDNLSTGAKIMLWGYFMKFAVGDRAAIYVDTVFADYASQTGPSLILATALYYIQLYCDFCGYSLLALGSAKIMGFDLINNFNRPFFATSITDLWRRWHISLTSWFRDYVYFPLGGSRCGDFNTYRNIFIVFVLSGLWHGAAYTFIIWGVYNGVIQILERMFKRRKDTSGVRKAFDIMSTFALFAYGLLIFYASDLSFVYEVTRRYFVVGMPYIHQTTIFFFAISFFVLMVKEYLDEYCQGSYKFLFNKSPYVSGLSFVALTIYILLFGVLSGGQFIYFKF